MMRDENEVPTAPWGLTRDLRLVRSLRCVPPNRRRTPRATILHPMNEPGTPQPKEELSIPDDWVFIDLEVAGERVHAIGAIRGDRSFRTKTVNRRTLAELVDFAEGATLLVGHNVWAHDRKYLDRLQGIDAVSSLPMLDTLPLSVISKPERPYHALVKGYKLVRAELSDPVEDCELARKLLLEEARLLRSPDWPQAFALAALCTSPTADGRGVRAFCRWIGFEPPSIRDAAVATEPLLREGTCLGVMHRELRRIALGEADPHPAAYAVTWLAIAGTSSVLPRWVSKQFPEARRLIEEMRVACCDDAKCTWCRSTNDETAALQRWFGFDDFRPEPKAEDGSSLQRAIVRNGMANMSTFAVLPTGGGKSICFQLPALVRAERTGALTVVLSPLQSLMKDQVDNLREQAESAVGQVNGSLTLPERARSIQGIADGRLAIVYISPEQLRNKGVRTALESREIGAWVFDEAHCLSKWGHDFRTDYLYAPRYIREHARLQGLDSCPPVFCFTATAQKQVVREVCDAIEKETGHILEPLLGGVERDNLTFEVRAAGPHEKLAVAAELIEERLPEGVVSSAIVFAATRKQTEEAAEYLAARGLPATAYHAGLDGHERRAIQDAFIQSERAVIAATSAFGMGVDKPDVRLVVHLTMPGSLESYLQQAGRAGRDRKPAHCVLLAHEEDAETQFRLARRSRLQHGDIQAIHRSIRRAPATKDGDGVRRTVVTHVELMKIGSARSRFNPEERFEQTRVSTAVSWLERAELITRDENVNRVFQGSLKTKTIDEAREKLAELDVSAAARARLDNVLTTLTVAKPDEALSADEIALHSGLWAGADSGVGGGSRVLDMLRDLARLKLLGEHTRYTAFVRHAIADAATSRFEEVSRMDAALLLTMREAAPDLDVGEVVRADFALIARKVFERLEISPTPVYQDQIRALWTSYERDGTGFRAGGKSLDLRFTGRSQYTVRHERDWASMSQARRTLLASARVVLGRILAELKPGQSGKDLLVAFDSDVIVSALEGDLETAPNLRDPNEVAEGALLLLHDARIITLQNGLAVFRQAMTIRHRERDRRRQFRVADYEPLTQHYGRRNTQIHVMSEYARLGVEDMEAARRLALDWFGMEQDDFLAKWMPGRQQELARATTQRSFDLIVTALGHATQESIVTADPSANHLVLAGPGSGKTRVIVHRIAYLIRVCGLEPAGIFALAYNRAAAYEIRRRLRDLVGADARFVRVHTLHGLAAELVGRIPDVAGLSSSETDAAFRSLIDRAAELLETSSTEGDVTRERLLGGCSHLLIDEYQDIDAAQARLVSALAGRLVKDGRKLAVLAVGDDDQNIYGFRGSSPEFIKAFAEEFDAVTLNLLDNFRSTRAIIDAANHLIEAAPGRLKTDSPIRIDSARAEAPAAGPWDALDEFAKGRVRLVYCEDDLGVGDFVADEMRRLRALGPRSKSEDFAVLGRTRRVLDPVREALRMRNESCRWTLGHGKGVPTFAVRELATVSRWLRERANELVRLDELIAAHEFLRAPRPHDPWARLVLAELAAWEDGYGSAPVVAATLATALRDAVSDERRSHAIGVGVSLGTLHSAKGLEFPHVFVLPTALRRGENDPESERRLLYVASTRAKETLTVVVPAGIENPFVERLAKAPNVDRIQWITKQRAERVDYELLAMGDLWIDWAGRQVASRLHEQLGELRYGSRVSLQRVGDDWVGVFSNSQQVAALGGAAAASYKEGLNGVIEAQVLAMIERRRDQTEDPVYQRRLVRDRWEVPVVEIRRRG